MCVIVVRNHDQKELPQSNGCCGQEKVLERGVWVPELHGADPSLKPYLATSHVKEALRPQNEPGCRIIPTVSGNEVSLAPPSPPFFLFICVTKFWSGMGDVLKS